jgi:diaminopimelate epimerase
MRVPFIKMHGAGNDFVVLDRRGGDPAVSPALVSAMADRRRGIGCDQLIVLAAAERGADATMLIHNADGSPAGTCGNAARCIAWLLAREGGRSTVILHTVAGLLDCVCLSDGRVRVDMGPPRLNWRDVPLARAMDTLHMDLVGTPAALSMGNPHVTFFVSDLAKTDVTGRGAQVELDPLFPDRVNVGFGQVIGPARLRLRVWERGAGLTMACGSGACAALVNGHRRGLLPREADVVTDGGTLTIAWLQAARSGEEGHVLMTGPVALAFRGEVDLSHYPA